MLCAFDVGIVHFIFKHAKKQLCEIAAAFERLPDWIMMLQWRHFLRLSMMLP